MAIAEALLDIDQVNQLTGLPQATLRNWEKRYGFPKPQRTPGGHRLYDVEQVRNIRQVAELCKSGVKVREAIAQVLSGGVSSVEAVEPMEPRLFQTLNAGLSKVIEALYRYDVALAEEHISRIGLRLSEADMLEMVYPKLLMQVGEDWECSRINIAQEHFSWNFFRTRLLNYFKTGQDRGGYQPKVLLATPSGELHEGGLIILAAYMMLKGWKVYYLGVSLPMEDLIHASETIQPDIVCLSAIDAANIQKSWADLERLFQPVVIGGPCLAQLKSQGPAASSRIFFVEGGLPSAVAQIELLLHSTSQKLKFGS